jgi:hypothetical protein
LSQIKFGNIPKNWKLGLKKFHYRLTLLIQLSFQVLKASDVVKTYFWGDKFPLPKNVVHNIFALATP